MTKDEALKMALDALETLHSHRTDIASAITAIKEALAQPEQDREEMKIKSVTMRCKDYDVALPIIYNDFGRVLVGQVSIPPNPKEPEQEPVAWMDDYNACKCSDNETRCFSDRVFRMMQKYTAPPKREWVGLTDEEILDVNMSTVIKVIDDPIVCDTDHNIIQLCKAIEARLKDKNNG
jgi:hypothetical protein